MCELVTWQGSCLLPSVWGASHAGWGPSSTSPALHGATHGAMSASARHSRRTFKSSTATLHIISPPINLQMLTQALPLIMHMCEDNDPDSVQDYNDETSVQAWHTAFYAATKIRGCFSLNKLSRATDQCPVIVASSFCLVKSTPAVDCLEGVHMPWRHQ